MRVYWFDPGDMRTQMHQEAFPGEDISDRPLPATVVPALVAPAPRRPAERALPGRRRWQVGERRRERRRPSGCASTCRAELEAGAPPEARGLTRDAVRMLVAERSSGRLTHTHVRPAPRRSSTPATSSSSTPPARSRPRSRAVAPRRLRGGRPPVDAARRRPLGGRAAPPRLDGDGPLDRRDRPARPDVRRRVGRSTSTSLTSAAGCGSRLVAPATADAHVARTSRQPDPLRLRRATRGRSRRTRTCTPTSPAAPRCRAPAGRSRRGDHPARRQGRRRRPARAAHRRRLAGGRRAALPRTAARPADHGGAGEPHPRAAAAGSIAVGTTVVRALETAGGDRHRASRSTAGPTSSSRPSAACASSTGCSPAGTNRRRRTC